MSMFVDEVTAKLYEMTARIEGQNEAWELARRCIVDVDRGGFGVAQLKEIFGSGWVIGDIVSENTYADAAEKVKKWEENKEINPADVVEHKETGRIGVVMSCNEFICDVLTGEGKWFIWDACDCTKTGRKLPVADWLKQIDGKDIE